MEQHITQKIVVQSPKELHDLLRANGIDLSQWGRHDAKTVTDLWQELVAEEAYLQDPPLRRIVPAVVRLIIRQGNRMLIEVNQAFSDGRTRSRCIPPSEKLRRGESCRDGALRCVEEELLVARSAVQVMERTHQIHHTMHRSRSYPGLQSQHTFHTVDVQVQGLPPGDFSTDEYRQDDGELYLRNSWAWQESSHHAVAFSAPHEAYSMPSRAACTGL
jgi:NUDIX domain